MRPTRFVKGQPRPSHKPHNPSHEKTPPYHELPYGRCNKELVWEQKRRETGRGAWEAHHIASQEIGGESILSNCEILCRDCHSRTF